MILQLYNYLINFTIYKKLILSMYIALANGQCDFNTTINPWFTVPHGESKNAQLIES